MFALIQPSGSAIQYIVLPGLLMTMGIGFSIVPSTIVATQRAEAGQGGLASGLVNTSRQVGGGLGLAVLISIATLHTSKLIGPSLGPGGADRGFRVAYLIGADCVVRAAPHLRARPPAAAARRPPGAGGQPPRPPPLPSRCFAAVWPRRAGSPALRGRAHHRKARTGPSRRRACTRPRHPERRPAGAQLPRDLMVANFFDLTQPPMVGQSGPLMLDSGLAPVWFRRSDQPRRLQPDRQTYEGRPVLTGGRRRERDRRDQQRRGRRRRPALPAVATLRARTVGLTRHEMIVRADAWVTANKNVPVDLTQYGGRTTARSPSGGPGVRPTDGQAALHLGRPGPHPAVGLIHPAAAQGFPWDTYHVNSVQLRTASFSSRCATSGRFISSAWAADKIIWTLGGKDPRFIAQEPGQV